MIYCDTSALAKLVLVESETSALVTFLKADRILVSSDVARTELRRAVLRRDPRSAQRVESVLERIELVAVRAAILDDAGTMSTLRSLDAIHLASARVLGPDLTAVVSYDVRMLEAAAAIGLPTASPA